MKNAIQKTIILPLLLSITTMAQSNLTLLQEPLLVTESDIYLDLNNNKFSDLITINFTDNIINLPVGVSQASINDINDVDVRNFLNSLVTQYGNITLEKVFPDLIWGDTERTNKRNGKTVTINDLSQVFQIHFSNLIPIANIISALSGFTAIEYAEGPYEIYMLSTEPNDPWYLAGEHWNLDSVFAKFAWDFTLGDTTITISINDFYLSYVTTLHEDLVDKVDYHHFNYFGGHGSAVASIAGVTTNNNLGISSLGWNLRLRLDRDYVQGIQAAINGGADVINFSWRDITPDHGRINAYDALNVASGAPHRPRDLVVTANALDEAQLDWNPRYYTEINQYKIYRAHTAGEPPTNWTLVATISAWQGFPNPAPVTSWTDVGTTVGSGPHRLWYRIVAVNNEQQESLPSDTDWIAWNKYGKKSSDLNKIVTTDYKLEMNYPNPFNPSTTINYTLKENGFVTLSVYDILGNEVEKLVNEKQGIGLHSVTFNAAGLVSGVYLYKLKVNDFVSIKKMILTK